MTGSEDFTYVTEKSILDLSSRGGVPVVQRLMLNFSRFNVSASPMDGGYVSALFLKCLPAGYLVLPT